MTITDAEIESLQKWGAPLDPQGMGALIKQAVHELLALRARVAEVKGERDRYLALLRVIAATHAPDECGTHTVCPDCGAVDHDPHRGSCAYEIAHAALARAAARAALAPPPPVPAGDHVTSLDCDHCGDVAIESEMGLFGDGDGEACITCGFPGSVSCDSETPPYWVLSDDDDAHCARADCEDDPCVAARADLAPPVPDPDPPCATCGHAESDHRPQINGSACGAATESGCDCRRPPPKEGT